MELAVHNKEGKKTTKKVTLVDSVFGVEPNEHVVYLDVKLYLANQRQGTHKAKERGEIIGSTKKIKKQKGTGTARAGSIKNPLFRGGGRVFGPRPRNYSFKLNKKLRKLARATALSYKATENKITILENMKFESPKTKEFVSLLENLNVANKKTLFVVANDERNVYLSSRNLKRSKVIPADKLNTYDILNADALILVEEAVEKIENLLKS